MRNQIVALEYKAYRVVAVAVPIGIGEGFRRSSRNVEIAVRVAVKPADDVVFPQPDGPRIETNSLFLKSIDMPRSASTALSPAMYVFFIFLRESM